MTIPESYLERGHRVLLSYKIKEAYMFQRKNVWWNGCSHCPMTSLSNSESIAYCDDDCYKDSHTKQTSNDNTS